MYNIYILIWWCAVVDSDTIVDSDGLFGRSPSDSAMAESS